jgi:hypothetical protein
MVTANKEATEPGFHSGYVEVITSNCYGLHHDFVNRYGISLSQITTNMLRISRKLYPVLSSFITYRRVCTKSNTGVTSGAGTIPDNLSSSPPVFRGVSVARSLVFV